ncbi:MAG TPA: DUF3368 domain-containing protein, partial [Caldilineaceae bacterium]|nr:DUF3368 domain-containing protein [Caldilineaceae bacterium]
MNRIVNTAPLIFLSKLGRLELLRQGVETVFVPSTVRFELRSVLDSATAEVESLLGGWLIERACTQLALLEVVRQSIDPGEAEVIALALELGINDVVLDDLDARRFARRNGLQPIGTLGLLLSAKENGLIVSVRDEIDRLQAFGFRASDVLIATVLASAGE